MSFEYEPITTTQTPAVSLAPTGDALIELLDQCCRTIEGLSALKKLAPYLTPNRGVHSSVLMTGRSLAGSNVGHDGVRSWITAGTLRDADMLSLVLREYSNKMNLRRRVTGVDWIFDNSAMKWCSENFGAPFTPDPTTEESEQKRAAEEKKDAEERERHKVARIQELAAVAEAEREAEKKSRVKRLMRELSSSFYTMEDADVSGDTPSPEYFAARQKRNIFGFYEIIVAEMVEDGMSDFDIKDEIEEKNRVRKGKFASVVPEPWPDGAIRKYFDRWEDALPTYENLQPDQIASMELAMDGRWCITVRTKTEEEMTEQSNG